MMVVKAQLDILVLLDMMVVKVVLDILDLLDMMVQVDT